MLDLVQTSFESEVVNTSEVLWTALIVMTIMAADDVFVWMSQGNSKAVKVSLQLTTKADY